MAEVGRGAEPRLGCGEAAGEAACGSCCAPEVATVGWAGLADAGAAGDAGDAVGAAAGADRWAATPLLGTIEGGAIAAAGAAMAAGRGATAGTARAGTGGSFLGSGSLSTI